MTWNPNQYLKFSDERTQPCRDLLARIALPSPRTIIDLGCGPGNSTAVLAERYPRAQITGIDSSLETIDTAPRNNPRHEWQVADITTWSTFTNSTFDLIFSNAALQWLPAHAELFPRLLKRATPNGVFAMQVPADPSAP